MLALTSAFFSCRTTVDVAPPGVDSREVLQGVPHRAWLLLDGDAILGTVVQFADPRWPQDPGRHFYSVRNPWQQEMGHVDAFGRTWRFVPHAAEPVWLCTTTLLDGVQRVLEAPASARLHEVPPASLAPGA